MIPGMYSCGPNRMAMVPEAIGHGRWPLSFSKLSDKAISVLVAKIVFATGFIPGFMLEGIVPAWVAPPGFLTGSVLSGATEVVLAAATAFLLASRMASSRARRMAAAMALPSFWSWRCF